MIYLNLYESVKALYIYFALVFVFLIFTRVAWKKLNL